MNENLNSLIYNPKTRIYLKRQENFLPKNQTFYFSYARVALKKYLKSLNVPGKVLVPYLICSDVLSCFFELEIEIEFYNVNRKLECNYDEIVKLLDKHNVTALFIVNYFGFPQPVDSLKKLTHSKDIILIEDNAHGFLSKDKDIFLGLRCDVGIFSLRKTISLPNGAAIVFNNEKLLNQFVSSNECDNDDSKGLFVGIYDIKFFMKEIFRPLLGGGGGVFAKSVLGSYRFSKGLLMKNKDDVITANPKVPLEPLSVFTKYLMACVDSKKEVKRRRELYLKIESFVLKDKLCSPAFGKLTEGVCPYGFPFYYEGDNIDGLLSCLWDNGLCAINWPGFLEDSSSDLPLFYKRIFLIPFLW